MKTVPSAEIELLKEVVKEVGGEQRRAQTIMVQLVAQSFSKPRTLLVEAGTGTGKSLGYLCPIIPQVAEGKVAIISTATLALQRQLISDDIPNLLDAASKLGYPRPRIALYKGWANYLCQRKLVVPEELDELFSDSFISDSQVTKTGAEIEKLRQWAEETETGDRDEVTFPISARSWAQVSTPTNACLGSKCEFYDRCFPRLAKDKVVEAQIIVTNHALVGIHCNGEIDLLPEHDILVVDEAHELEERVRAQATVTFWPTRLLKTLKRAAREYSLVTTQIEEQVETIEKDLDKLELEELPQIAAELNNRLILLQVNLGQLAELLPEANSDDESENYLRLVIRNGFDEALEALDKLTNYNNLKQAAWVGEDLGGNRHLSLAPLEVGRSISDRLLEGKKSLLASATLRICGDFQQTARTLGFAGSAQVHLESDELEALKMEFPPAVNRSYGVKLPDTFDYKKQGLLYVAAQLPRPEKRGMSELQLSHLLDLVEVSRGGALGLFSSRYALDQAAEYLRDRLDYPVLVQGDHSLAQLIKQYKDDFNACLLGTMSLWQGVDVPGLTSRLVVIDRIPFPRPTDPIIAARSRAVDARGGNAFMEVSLSRASLLLAQGAGRLIRAKGDRGVVAVLDSRLYSARYRNFLLNGLPAFSATINENTTVKLLNHLVKKSGRAKS